MTCECSKMQTEIDWWRRVFMCRFLPGNFPRLGEALFGLRFRLQWEDVDGQWHDWKAEQ